VNRRLRIGWEEVVDRAHTPRKRKRDVVEYDKDRVDEMVLALPYLTSSQDEYATRAWKGMNLKRWTGCTRLVSGSEGEGRRKSGTQEGGS